MRTKNLTKLAVVVLAAYGFVAQADDRMIGQLEKLRSSLAVNDEGRGELTLRIADMHFYEAVEKTKQSDLSQDQALVSKLAKDAATHRLRSLELYRESLNPKTSDDLRTKIEFQMAQLLGGLGRQKEAMPFWQKLAQQQLQPKIRAEALLRLAQTAEEQGSTKDAETHYRAALQHCQAHDVCSFIRYRLSWLLKSQNKMDEAIAEIQKSLWDSNGSIQEEVLRDYLVFWSAKAGNGQEALTAVDTLAQKIGRPNLIQQLADNFTSAGNKAAALAALRLVEDRAPNLSNELRLMEEYYAIRSWDSFRGMLQAAERSVEQGSTTDANGEKLLLRMVIQLDGERDTQKEYAAEFQRTAMLYLALYPKTSESFRVMESWLAAESEADRKLAQTAQWLENPKMSLTTEQVIRFRELRASLAQEKKNHDILQTEMRKLESLYTNADKKREAQYVLAKSLYETKDLDGGLQLFQKLAAPQAGQKMDKYSLLSQNLALDVYNQKKAYGDLIQQAERWLKDPQISKDVSLSADLKQMQEVVDQAKFESAVLAGQQNSALQTFSGFCLASKLVPQSCNNARTLAIQLGDKAALIQILEKQGAKQELAQELEATAHFAKAAELQEKEKPLSKDAWTGADAIKIALLYELDGNFADRDRWLNALANRYKKRPIDIEEGLLFQTLLDSQLLQPSLLSVRWSETMRPRVAHALEMAGKGNAETQKILLASKTEVGPLWAFAIEKELFERDSKQRGIQFYGKNSKQNFQKRLASLNAAEAYITPYLEGASLETRASLLVRLHSMFQDLVQEIRGAPVPADLDDETKQQIMASLEEMAKPFLERATNYANLAKAQIEKLSSAEQKAEFSALLDRTGKTGILAFTKSRPSSIGAPNWERATVANHFQSLHQNPAAKSALTGLRDFFQDRQQSRLSSYFEGRIRSVEKEGSL